MTDPNRALSYKKSQWIRRTHDIIKEASSLFRLVKVGAEPDVADIYYTARVIMELGMAGERLHKEAASLDMLSSVCYSIEHRCSLLQVCNTHFFKMLERLGHPTGAFATYVSSIPSTVAPRVFDAFPEGDEDD